MDPALKLPVETFRWIFKQLDDEWQHYALRQALQVSKSWFEQATLLLWRTSTIGELWRIADNRRQVYANKVQRLTLAVYKEYYKASELSFPLLRSIKLENGAYQDTRPGKYKTWDPIRVYGQNLQSIIIDGDLPSRKTVDFIALLKGCADLRRLRFQHSGWRWVDPDILAYSATLKGLEAFATDGKIGVPTVEALMDKTDRPFPTIQRLQLCIEWSIARQIISSDSITLTHLQVTLCGEQGSGSLVFLSSLKSLETLLVELQDNEIRYKSKLRVSEMMALKTLPRLQLLIINGHEVSIFPRWTEERLRAQLGTFPTLEVVQLSSISCIHDVDEDDGRELAYLDEEEEGECYHDTIVWERASDSVKPSHFRINDHQGWKW